MAKAKTDDRSLPLFSEPERQEDPEFRKAVRRRDRGMAASTGHADRAHEGWRDLALAALEKYVRTNDLPFLVETFRAWALAHTLLPEPPDRRAWGGVIRSAAVQGLIVQAGTAKANSSNRSPKYLWRRACAK